jgi:4-hydroxy-tetrahydrodipicolinate synthase
MKKFQGTGVAMTTAFHADGALDFDGISRLTEHLVQGGVEFLVVLGTTGEAATIDAREQEQVVEAVIAANAGRLPVVLGVGGNDTLRIVEKARDWTAKFKPDALLSVSPYYSKPSQEGIFRHFAAIAEAVDTPIILYNVPGRTSSNMTAATTVRIARAYKHVVATKEASGNFEQVMEVIRDRPEGFLVLSGDDAITLPLLGAGADGVISVVANAVPRPFGEMVRRGLAGDFGQARALHYPLLRFTQMLFEEGNPVGIKAALELLGIGGAHVRLPLWGASEGLRARLKAELQSMGAIG